MEIDNEQGMDSKPVANLQSHAKVALCSSECLPNAEAAAGDIVNAE